MAGLEYLKSKKGILKLLEELFNIIALACVASEATGPRGEAFLVASIGAFIITALIIFVRVLGLDEKISAPWSKIELGYCIIWGVFYLITSALVIDADAYNEYLGVSTFSKFEKIQQGFYYHLYFRSPTLFWLMSGLEDT